MREIKFRVWDKERKCWCYWDDLAICPVTPQDSYKDGNNLEMSREGWVEGADFSNYIFQQSTGLKDKKKQDIYEGDILKENSYLYQVYWLDNTASFEIVSLKEYEFPEDYNEPILNWFNLPRLEIVGNIYENPELLKN